MDDIRVWQRTDSKLGWAWWPYWMAKPRHALVACYRYVNGDWIVVGLN